MATERTISVRLRANVDDFKRQLGAASQSLEQLTRNADGSSGLATTRLGRLAQSARLQEGAWQSAGVAMAGFGAATTAAMGLAAKAAMDWESAFAGVRKTVDASEAEYVALSGQLRAMTGEVSASHTEIAEVAEAAGQLGVKTGAIVGFTRTMIDLGEATNMGATEAATALARFSNIMGTSQGEVSRLGSAIVDLGNNFETTEREIVEMAMRLAGAGKNVGLTEGEVLGLATALSSVGIEAEAGGSAFSRVMVRIGKAADLGGGELETFARVAGMSAKDFARAYKTDAGGAITAFIKGLGRVEEQGGSLNQTLDDMGMKDLRVADTLRRLSLNAEGVAEAMATGNKAFEENTALAAEAAQRYATTEAQLAMMKNQIVDAGIEIGAALLPALRAAATTVTGLIDAFKALPGPVKSGLGVVGSVVGVAALAGGALLTLTPRILATATAFSTMRASMATAVGAGGKFTGRLAGLARFAGKAGVAGAVLTLGYAAVEAGHAMRGATRDTEAWLNVLATAPGTLPGELTKGFDNANYSAKELASGLQTLARPSTWESIQGNAAWVADGLTGLVGVDIRADVTKLGDRLKELDKPMAALAASSPEKAVKGFRELAEMAGGSESALNDLLTLMPEYKVALTSQATAAGMTADRQLLIKMALGEVGAASKKAGVEVKDASGKMTTVSKEAAEAMDAALSRAADAWTRMFDATKGGNDAKKSLSAWITDMQAQLKNMHAYTANMAILTRRGLSEQGRALIESLDPKAAQLRAAQLVKATESEFATFNRIAVEAGSEGGAAYGAAVVKTAQAELKKPVTATLVTDTNPAMEGLAGFAAKATAPVTKPVKADTRDALNAAELLRGRVQAPLGTNLSLDTRPAVNSFDWFKNQASKGVTTTLTVNAAAALRTVHNAIGSVRTAMIPLYRAKGGPVWGPGTSTSDSIPALLSNGEHVITAKEVRGAGGHQAVHRLRELMAAGTLPRFAGGGPVAATKYVPAATSSNGTVVNFGGAHITGSIAMDAAGFGRLIDGRIVAASRATARRH